MPMENTNGLPCETAPSAGDSSGLASGMSALNIKAQPFVPGKNIFANEFVPCFSTPSSVTPIQPTSSSVVHPDSTCLEEVGNNTSDIPHPPPNSILLTALAAQITLVTNKVETPEDWSDKVSDNSNSVPDDDGLLVEEDDEEARSTTSSSVGAKPKKQPKPVGVNRTRKDHLNVIFIGHVDAGKSTIGGQIMYLTGQVDKRTLEKYEKEAKEKNRESWYLSWALDTNIEERDKGKTVEVGRAFFETDNKHFTILDAPGHKSFVPNMIGGASQADIAVLVISARKGEFETGFDRGGQTREHAMLVKTAGVRHLVVVVNKMDDPTVEWDEARFIEIREKLTPYLKKCGFNPKTDLFYLPVSGLTGVNLKDVDRMACPWYEGLSLIQYFDSLPPVSRMADVSVRLPVVDRYKDMGTIILGKVESGVICKGQILTLMPNKVSVEVMQLYSDDFETEQVYPGENVKLKLKNVEEEDVSPGFILCSPDNLCHTARVFDAQIVIMEHKSIICAGYSAVLHVHTCAEEVVVKALICLVDRKTGEKSTTRPRFIKQDQIAIVRLEVLGGLICVETFKDFPQMGRFTLRDEGRTIGIGKIVKVVA